MSICYVYHSETGHTRKLLQRCQAATGGEIVEVEDLEHYSRIMKFIRGARRARQGVSDPIAPAEIEVSGCDALVLGSPVWGGMPTPAINAAIRALRGCEGKNAVVVVTCGGNPGKSIEVISKALEERGMHIISSMVFTVRDLRDNERVSSLIELAKKAEQAPKS
jgi:hypothetical protein